MNAADFIAQYALVILAVLTVAHRDLWPWMGDGNIERVIRQEQRDLDAFSAKIILARMSSRRV